jgi:Prophage tail length tape measure protein
MSEENRKIQIESEVVADTSGLQEIKVAAQDMAQAVQAAGQQAGAGLSKVGDGAAPAAAKVDAATRSIVSSIQRATATMKAGEKGTADFYDALGQSRGIDTSALKGYTDELRKVEAAQKQAANAAKGDAFVASIRQQAESIGKTRSQLIELQAAQLGVADKVAPYLKRLQEIEQGQTKVGISAKQTAAAMRGVPAQFTDIVTSLASGQNPITVILQQGGQLKDMFGGVGNAVKAVTSLITPMTAAIGIGAAALGGLALALSRVESEARGLNTLQAQLSATGRGDMFGTGELKKFVDQLALMPGVSREVAEKTVSELSKVKEIGPVLFRDLSKAAVDYAKATGTDVPAAARTLAQAFKDPEKGAKQLDEALGKLSSAQILHIEKLAKQNDLVGAQKALFDALAPAIRGLADGSMTPLQKSTEDLGNAWEKAMQRLGQSDGLKNLHALLAKTVEAVAFLVGNADKVGGLSNVGLSLTPGALPAAVGNAAGSGLRQLFTPSSETKFEGKGATGSFDVAAGADRTNKDKEDALKRTLDAAKGDRSEADRLAELTTKRDTYNKALADSISLYGKESEQAKRMRGAVAAVDEQIAAAKKKAAGPVSREADQTRQAALDAELARFRDSLQEERDTLAFHERQLQNQYQAGALSLTDYYERRRQAIQAGVKAAVDEMEREKTRIAEDRDFFASKGDTSRATQLQGKIDNLSRDQDKALTRAGREVELSNEAQAESYRQLADEVTNYRANLLQLQGDEAGAARLRADQAIEQARRLAKRADGSPAAIPEADVQRQAEVLRQINLVNEARRQSGIVASALALEEERIAMAQRAGAITSYEALSQVGDARKRVVAQLEEVVKAQEEVARTRPQDYELQINTARARQDLERLKQDLDPLAEQFRSLFTDVTGNLFADLANDPRNGKEALKRWANSISSEMTRDIGRNMSAQLFGKDGPLGKLPGAFGDMFGKSGKDAQKPLVDTVPLSGSLSSLKTAGVDPLTASFQRLQQVVDSAARPAPARPADAGAQEPAVPGVEPVRAPQTAGAEPVRAPQPAGDVRAVPTVDTAPLAGSLSALKTYGVDPLAASFQRLQQIVDTAARPIPRDDSGAQEPAVPGAEPVRPPPTVAEPNVVRAPEVAPNVVAGDFATASLQRLQLDAMQRAIGGQPAPAPQTPGLPPVVDPAQPAPVVERTFGGPTEPAVPAGEQKVFDQFRDAQRSVEGFTDASAQAMQSVLALASSAGHGGQALSLLPYIIKMIQAAAAASSSSGASGSGFVGSIAGMFGGASAAGGAVNMGTATGADLALFYHDGGLVGKDKDIRPTSGLKANEVPAVLMGGPKGVREEVLTADDPRHSDNMSPQLKRLIDRMPRYHEGGVVGEKSYMPSVANLNAQAPAPSRREEGGDGRQQVFHIHVEATPGTTRATAKQTGVNVWRGMQVAAGSNR